MNRTHLGYHQVFHQESNVCEYFSCNVAKISGRNCADFKNCQTWKYYQRYGFDNHFIRESKKDEPRESEDLGIGTIVEVDLRRLK